MKFSSALVLSFVSAAALAESITTTVTATKDGHVYTKTVTQDATFVWEGEGSYASSSAADSSSAAPAETTSSSSAEETSTTAEETSSTAAPSSSEAPSSSADEGSGSSITTTITATKDGHVYTKTVTQDATFVWTGEGSYSGSATWSTASSSAESSASTESTVAPTTTVEPTSSETASSSATLPTYTGAAGAVTVGSGLMGAAVAAAFLL